MEKRRQIEKKLATNPDNRAELERLVVRMLDHEETQRDILRELEFYDRIAPNSAARSWCWTACMTSSRGRRTDAFKPGSSCKGFARSRAKLMAPWC